jgi:hypothetical protein
VDQGTHPATGGQVGVGGAATFAGRAPRRGGDDTGLVISWLVRLVVAFALGGLVLFEIGGVLISRITAADTAAKAAEEAGFAYRDTGDYQRARAAAQEKVESEGATLDELTIDPQSRTATVKVHKTAKTFVIQHIDVLVKYTIASATETTPLPS